MNAHESARQYVLQEAPQELGGVERHLPLLVSARIIFPAEGNALSIEGQQAVAAAPPQRTAPSGRH